MNKIKTGIIFGGVSTEHNVSIVSGTSVIKNLNKDKYQIFPIKKDKNGDWYEYEIINKEYKVGEEVNANKKIINICEYLKKLDVVFPVLHGLGGEDGSIQGLLEMLNIPYVGSKILGSSICMDKVYAKAIFEKANLLQADYIYIRKYKDSYIYIEKDFSEQILDIEEISKKIIKKLKLPLFIKPSNSGSSVGINKAENIEELKDYIEHASMFDKKILIEENISGREIECAVLGNEEVEASILGEIIPADKFYSFDAKYNNNESKTIMPADLNENLSKRFGSCLNKSLIVRFLFSLKCSCKAFQAFVVVGLIFCILVTYNNKNNLID